MSDRRQTAAALVRLEQLIQRMDGLGAAGEDAADRITAALGGSLTAAETGTQAELVRAIGDVIDIVTERSRLAHEAHRVITEIRNREAIGWNAMPDDKRGETRLPVEGIQTDAACTQCGAQTSLLVYQRVATAVLFCSACEAVWTAGSASFSLRPSVLPTP